MKEGLRHPLKAHRASRGRTSFPGRMAGTPALDCGGDGSCRNRFRLLNSGNQVALAGTFGVRHRHPCLQHGLHAGCAAPGKATEGRGALVFHAGQRAPSPTGLRLPSSCILPGESEARFFSSLFSTPSSQAFCCRPVPPGSMRQVASCLSGGCLPLSTWARSIRCRWQVFSPYRPASRWSRLACSAFLPPRFSWPFS